MSFRREMLQVARLAPKLLGESAELVRDFVLSQQHPEGGFCDRSGNPDLYYSTFGLAALSALQVPCSFDAHRSYLDSKAQKIESLSLIELSCLARCWAALATSECVGEWRMQARDKLQSFRSEDGGFSDVPEQEYSTLYGLYVAIAAAQDLDIPLDDPSLPSTDVMLRCIESMRAQDGGYSNEVRQAVGLTPPTAAAASLLRTYTFRDTSHIDTWLLERVHPEGGFCVAPEIPMPDLLSTATALHALSPNVPQLDAIREPCLDFIDTLWTAKGGFYGTWEDDTLDLEYTYYGLLSLGHLSL